MANEAVIVELIGKVPGCPINYTVADGVGIEKGTIMYVDDARLAVAHSGIDQPIIGIAAAEKVASDGSTTLAVYTNGIFDITAAAAGATAIGAICAPSATANMFTPADGDDLLQGSTIGQLYEAADNDEIALVRVLK